MIKINRDNIRSSVVIWFCTAVLGSSFLWISGIIGLKFYEILILSLVFSAPSVFFLIVNLRLLACLPHQPQRIVHAIISIFLVCLVVIRIFLWVIDGYPLETHQIILLLAPYVVAAQVSFLFVARNLILKKTESYKL
jgi:hypothetical protein